VYCFKINFLGLLSEGKRKKE